MSAPAPHRIPNGSFLDVLHIATPLVIASASAAVRLFSDRVMLAHYQAEAFAASFSAGVTYFTILGLFMYTANYASTFVAQYVGARQESRVGPAVWQSVMLALLGGLVLLSGLLWGRPFFALLGHGAEILEHQTAYFEIMCAGSVFPLLIQALGSFWGGRGKTWVIAGIEWTTVGINIAANYALIFGHWGFPEMGIRGAAIGTAFAAFCGAVLALFLFLQPANRRRFNTWPKAKFEAKLFLRLLEFGLPNGIQVCLDIAAFNVFVLAVHGLGAVERAACTIAFTVNAMVFVPMLGLGTATSILVGQNIGAKKIAHAERAVANAGKLMFLYLLVTVVVLGGFPEFLRFLFPLQGQHNPQEAWIMASIFLKFLSVFLFFHGFYILIKFAINGAGDTKFSLRAGALLSWCCFAIPSLLSVKFGASVYTLWGFLVFFSMTAVVTFSWRYRRGRWRSLSVIKDSSRA